ncbi:MAG: hypothetical protein UHM08_04535 [Bacteroidales bacterium]|nr:hypothetical protein [Bacteroidales bacterium]
MKILPRSKPYRLPYGGILTSIGLLIQNYNNSLRMQTNLNKEKIQTLIDKQRTNLADVEYLDLDSVAKILQNFENTSFSGDISERQGEKNYTDEELSYENDPIAKVLDKPKYSHK